MDTTPVPDISNWINTIHDQSLTHGEEIPADNTPIIAMQFKSEKDAYDFYNEYARRIGFGIHREYRNLSKKDGILTSRRFSCHKKGERGVDKRDYLTKDGRAETRTGCQAHMSISLDREVGNRQVTFTCIDVYEKEDEFLRAWDALLVQHGLPTKSWLETIFEVKEKWAWAYVISAFTPGMRSTQLSENLNSHLKSHLKSDLNLVEFFTHFERVVNAKRYNESKAEYDSIHKLPRLKMEKALMLIQAGNLYTPKIFEEFQEDYEEFLGAYIQDHKEDQLMHIYTVANINKTKEQIVVSNALKQTVYCDCRKFETHGILCSHALNVLDIMNIKLIPDHYILKRWTRDARRGLRHDGNEKLKEVDMTTHFTSRYRELCPRIGSLVNRACESHETYTFMSKVCEESMKIVEQMLAKRQCVGEEVTKTCHVSISMTNEDPGKALDTIDYSSAKGIKKKECPYKKKRSRPKTLLEKSNRKANVKPKQRRKNSMIYYLDSFVDF
ncbi:protein FAR-RED IMPAIRED RESPONSE 1-like [Silene latifolia]|uniref:protein FAR-RED IMPAIRED RESPONSE 1-like n=1 Tax=Silene latifolia TaxID=37657 RepID=UPI003D780E0B